MNPYKNRQARFRQAMRDAGIDGYIVTQNVDLYYLTGTMQTGLGVFPAEGEPVLYVRRSLARACAESEVRVEPMPSYRELGGALASAFPGWFEGGRKVRLATEFDVLPVQQFRRLEAALPGAEWLDGSRLMRELRMIKSAEELAPMREAARIVDVTLEKAIARLQEGMTELELMAYIEHSIRLHGHMGLMRMRAYNQEIVTGMVGAGEAAARPTYFDGPAGGQGLGPACPQSASRRPIGRGEPILLDLGCCIDGYVIDQTRTAVIGDLPDDLRYAYDVSERILREVEERLVPGTVCEDLYKLSLQLAKGAGLREHFMGYGPDQVKFLGHGIGLEIDEWPVLAMGFDIPLQAGMVIAVEPKFTFPGRGVVGVEDTYLITPDGFERLTVSRRELIRIGD
ncbi:M24 family metallopeptidase [Paenibacillus thermoaerophilus]|uniref:M24 family metallopeptidase n=1 Tax=Paenibacillus thermoaerophilus TaxID=1215385 RepID=A0ABW2V6W2_9BACL|nr:Xaa-Pro peptidase family protein [Paenibacillus thermoaerophilus]TMV16110.1 aminopeptidase P family protein [Paenibacillus thermoaerophilus]